MSENQLENQLQVKKIRILIGKVGLDGHDRGAKVIAAAFRDAGIEVIYTGLRQTPETIVEAALQEDVDAIGISILSGAHMTIFPKVKKLMDDKGLNDVLLFGGGIIPDADIEELKKLGIGQLFTPGTPTFDTINYVKKWVLENKERENL
ncbi:MAG: cobalamin B12-binding domain-containing protein [Ignavibacteria bacterium]|nr:cobalamin B12-binding domain-containing protein [Ignavibacteria bacterium]MBK7252911.1 cobalamin B12-binding domain-containing protein [Ignavibacteria bacterium]MBK7445864.1 cobalamin B12-binding domain-containing protein [Ignavibacteria bacterium]MBK9404418.1 cobalamin B12-binding domain-containing protein [Ignavibacteria bacterium]MBL0108983.1 cobalamin B12-binding domain-containing protein [Ignavibacteria bacterium]